MNKSGKDEAALVRDVEKLVGKRLRELQSTQTFDGTLRIKLDKVFVDKKDGQRALEHLRQMSSSRLLKAK
nr:hypothetical protein [uncultured Pseudoxanthomonas sp.]